MRPIYSNYLKTTFLALALALVPGCSDDGGAHGDSRVRTDGGPNDASPDASWRCDGEFAWPVAEAPVSIKAPSDPPEWKNSLVLPSHLIAIPDLDNPRWIKFTIFLAEPEKVYFQDSQRYKFHYDFAKERLDPFVGITRADFEAKTLHKRDRVAVLGAVIFPPEGDERPEYGVQLISVDPLHPQLVKRLFASVKASISGAKPQQAFYFPTTHQEQVTAEYSGCFQGYGIQVDSADRFGIRDTECYSTGWAIGRLTRIASKEIDKAYEDGRLRPQDILLTDAIPAEVPHVAGIISLKPATPNSHVAILAKTFGIPFVHFRHKQAEIEQLAGKEVILRLRASRYEVCKGRVLDVDGKLDDKTRSGLLAAKKPPKVTIVPRAKLGRLSAKTSTLESSDIQFFGGKASNFRLLRKAVPENSPDAIAFSFDLWDGFLQQTLSKTQTTLAAEIEKRIKGQVYPPNLSALKASLKEIRDLIEDDATFSADQVSAISAALADFDPKRKIRFRSSTNVEDSDVFTGAGLYESKSGCLADDQDTDEAGPSLCDGNQAKERGVLRAIRKVFASFYNDNAFIERLRFGISERDVGMALLVHYSFPDETEMANGVATVERDAQGAYTLTLVTQAGAASVTNPASNARPEVAKITSYPGSSEVYLSIEQRSSLLPLGSMVLDDEPTYVALSRLLMKVTKAYEAEHPAASELMLDLEYKRITPGDLVIKQVRSVPLPSSTAKVTPFLIAEDTPLCVHQGEQSDVFAFHRLKSFWSLKTASMKLDDAARQRSIFNAEVSLKHAAGGTSQTLNGAPASWPNATHQAEQDSLMDSFEPVSGVVFSLRSAIPRQVPLAGTPIVLLSDFTYTMEATYKEPVAYLAFYPTAGPARRSREDLVLTQNCNPFATDEDLVTRELKGPDGLTITTSYFHPHPDGSIMKTAPLARWEKTEIVGLTSKPFELRGPFSASYRPEHHNFAENFIFEPALEPGIDAQVLAELAKKDIRLIHATYDNGNTVFHLMGLDGTLRPL